MKLALKIPPVAVVIVIALIMYFVSKALPQADLNKFTVISEVVTTLCYFTGLIGTALGLSGVAAFIKAKTTVHPQKLENTSSLVTSGLYRFTRNPMYLGLLLLLISFGLYLANFLSLLIALMFVPYMNTFQIKPEEKYLERGFGEEYLNYKNKVRRWL